MKDTTHILRAVGNIYRLLATDRDREVLLKGICDNLVRHLGYHVAWVVHVNDSGRVVGTASSGLGEYIAPLAERLGRGELPSCAQKALALSAEVRVENPLEDCKDCPLSQAYGGRAGMAGRLEYQGKVYGLLVVSVRAGPMREQDEERVFEELRKNVAFALHSLGVENERERAIRALQESTDELGKRVKELNCLYGISDLVERPGVGLEEILDETVVLIPPAMQHAAAACARIVLDGREFSTDRFQETEWKLARELTVSGRPAGFVEVCYLEEPRAGGDGPFLIEEKKLIEAVARRLGRITERTQAREALANSEKNLRDLVEGSVTGILIVQDGSVVYSNPQCSKLLGAAPETVQFVDPERVYREDADKATTFFEKLDSEWRTTPEVQFRFHPETHAGQRTQLKWIHCRASKVEYQGRDSILVNITDMTKAKELERLLRIEDKMSSLGRMTAGIAHEIRNPLSGINIYLSTLEKIYDNPERSDRVGQILQQVQSASRKIESVIKRVLDFSRSSEPEFVLTDINEAIREAIQLSAVALRKRGIVVGQFLAEDLPLCSADGQMIGEVVVNLLANAAEAMKGQKGDRRIQVSSSASEDRILIPE